MAKSLQLTRQKVTLNVADAMPGTLLRPMKMAEPSPFELAVPFSEKLPIRLRLLSKT